MKNLSNPLENSAMLISTTAIEEFNAIIIEINEVKLKQTVSVRARGHARSSKNR